MSSDFGTIVVGAGVVGLAVARSLALAGQDVLIVEQHALIGSEVSSRNSEVIHAGLYYPPGSLRATLCVRGKELLYEFCQLRGVPHRRLGKLLVATEERQRAKLEDIARTAAANGVDDLIGLDAAAARKLEPEVTCVAALLSPSTGIIDSHAFMLALQGEAESHGAMTALATKVSHIAALPGGGFQLQIDDGAEGTRVTCRRLVLAAGLHGSRLAATLEYPNGYRPPVTTFARGHYYALSGRSPFQRLVYPMPDGAWLGIHVTLDLSGRAKFGPDLEWISTIDYAFNAANEEKFYQSIRRYWPGLPDGALGADYTGIRPKIYREGEPVPDFAIHGPETHGLDGLVMLFGIESPGLTASLAIAEHVAEKHLSSESS